MKKNNITIPGSPSSSVKVLGGEIFCNEHDFIEEPKFLEKILSTLDLCNKLKDINVDRYVVDSFDNLALQDPNDNSGKYGEDFAYRHEDYTAQTLKSNPPQDSEFEEFLRLNKVPKEVKLPSIDVDSYTVDLLNFGDFSQAVDIPGYYNSLLVKVVIYYTTSNNRVNIEDAVFLSDRNFIRTIGNNEVELDVKNGTVKIFPKKDNIVECIINNCFVTYGKL